MTLRLPLSGRPLFQRTFTLAFLAAVLSCAHAPITPAAIPTNFSDELVVGGLKTPVGMAFLPDGRVLVIEQKSSRIMLVRPSGTPRADSVGMVPNVNGTGSERGLLGVAVDPGWPARPYVYTHSNHTTGFIRISRFTASGALSDPAGLIAIDPASRYDLITNIPDEAFNHNGGSVRFARDGRLYVSLGEDANAPAAQDTSSLRGVILRLDVSRLPAGPGTATRDLITPPDNPFVAVGSPNSRLIWQYGLRNPFRIQFDALTGEALIADVGQDTWEEVDIANTPAMNFGWPHYEGNAILIASQPLTGPATLPIYVVDHATTGALSIMAACIYRHPAGGTRSFPAEYEGDVFVSDYFAGFLRRLHRTGDTWAIAAPVPGQPSATDWGNGFQQVSDYALGAEGALWYVKQNGEIHRIVHTGSAGVGASRGAVAFARPYPSPTRTGVEFDWTLPAPARVALAIHDVRGRRVRLVVPPRSDGAGHYHTSWNGRDEQGRAVAPGIYFARLSVDGRTLEQRVPVVR